MTLPQRLAQAINARPAELSAALCGFALFFCLFSGYFMLRPIREAMGIQGGVENLQWLFTATFFVMLAAVPLFAWLNSKVPRARYIDWVYGVFISQLLLFAVLLEQTRGEGEVMDVANRISAALAKPLQRRRRRWRLLGPR